MNVSYCFFLFSIKMASTSSLKSKRKTIEGLVEKQERWAFTDTEWKVDKKTTFKWNTLFQELQYKEFQVFLHDDPTAYLSKGIYNNISKSGLHRAATKTWVLPCPYVIEWMTWRIDHESITILNFEGRHVSSYQAPILNPLYHFKGAQVKVTPEWLESKVESIDFLSALKGWWSEGNFRSNPTPIGWIILKFRKSIQIIVILMSNIFERKDASHFLDKWIPIIHQVITYGSILNWGEIISSNLNIQL